MPKLRMIKIKDEEPTGQFKKLWETTKRGEMFDTVCYTNGVQFFPLGGGRMLIHEDDDDHTWIVNSYEDYENEHFDPQHPQLTTKEEIAENGDGLDIYPDNPKTIEAFLRKELNDHEAEEIEEWYAEVCKLLPEFKTALEKLKKDPAVQERQAFWKEFNKEFYHTEDSSKVLTYDGSAEDWVMK